MSHASGPRGPRRVDESMTLLTEIMDRPLDPSYAAVAEARAGRADESRSRPWNSLLVGVATATAGLLFATSALTYADPAAGRSHTRADLVARIEDRQREIDRQSARARSLETELRSAESRALGQDDGQTQDLDRLRMAAGADPVTGPGVRITLDDAAGLEAPGGGGPREDDAHDDGRVVDRDLQNVTNLLWAHRAEAVSINGHRLTSSSAIRAAGRAILVGYRPLARPYVVEAVIGPEDGSAFWNGDGGAYLKDLATAYGARAELEVEASLSLPGAESSRLRHATVPDTGRPPSTPTTAKDNG